MAPHDHIGWVFDGVDAFNPLARSFLTEGAAKGERLMFVAEDPDPAAVEGVIDIYAREVQMASIAEVYGASGVVDPVTQRATFANVLADAVAEGYTGIRVPADNTPLVLDAERRAAWRCWENVADRFMSENPVTGLCAFDRTRVDIDQLRHLASLHPLLSAASPTPQYRLFTDDEALWVEGLLDTFAVGEIRRALQVLPPKTPLVVDLEKVTLLSNKVLESLADLGEEGIEVRLEGSPDAAGETWGLPAT